MFYCPKCLNIYNISKTIKTQTAGANDNDNNNTDNYINSLIKKIVDDPNNYDTNNIKITKSDIENLSNLPVYKKLTNKQKDHVYNFLNDIINEKNTDNNNTNLDNKLNIMHFLCKNCGNHEQIKNGTVIINRTTKNDIDIDIDNNNFNPKEYLQMKVLPHTRDYYCPNNKCESHKESEKKSAIFMRLKGTYKIRYICECCESSWMVS